ncbi:MAG: hypothetical protein AB7N76_10455 [Planctomycetota bacterium]
MKRSANRAASAVLVVLALLAGVGLARADEGARPVDPSLPTLAVKVGVGGKVHGEWTQLEIEARLAEGAPAFAGRLQVAMDGTQVAGCQARLELAPGSVRVLRLAVPVVRGESYRVRLVDAEGQVRSEQEPEDDSERVDGALGLLLAPTGLQALDAKDRKGGLRLARIAPGALPADSRTLEELQVVFLPLGPESLELARDERAVAALRSYVELGGRLVLLAQPAAPRTWVGTPLEALCPVRDPHPTSVSTADASQLLGALSDPLPAVSSTLAAGARWTRHTGGLGLIAERRQGEGEVAFVAFDPDGPVARGGDRLAAALDQLAAARTRSRALDSGWDLDRLADGCYEAREVLSSTGFGLLVGALVLQAFLIGPLTLMLARKRRRPWLSLVVPAALSALLGVLILIVATLVRGRGREARAVVVVSQPEAGRGGLAYAELALFAASPTSYELDLAGRWTPLGRERGALQALQFRQLPPWIEVVDGDARRVGPIQVPAQGLSRWRLRGRRPPLPLRVEQAGSVFTLASERELDGLYGLHIGKQGVGVEALPRLVPGQPLRWAPAPTAPSAQASSATIGADPFVDVTSREAVVHRLAQRLGLVSAQRLSQSGAFPTTWVVQVALGEADDLSVSADGEPVPVRALSLTVVPLEAP